MEARRAAIHDVSIAVRAHKTETSTHTFGNTTCSDQDLAPPPDTGLLPPLPCRPTFRNWDKRLKAHLLTDDWSNGWTTWQKLDFLKKEILLGVTICFAQIPESVAFAFMAHVAPPVALHAAWIVGIIGVLLGGRSGMVEGAEGAFAAIIATFVDKPEQRGMNGANVELLFPAVMVAGVCMLVVWLLRGQKLINLVAASVMDGFCCGLAVVIGLSQLHPFYEQGPDNTERFKCSASCTAHEFAEVGWMLVIMFVSMLTMEFVPKVPLKGAKLLPSSLLAILLAVLIEYAVVRNTDCPVSDTDLDVMNAAGGTYYYFNASDLDASTHAHSKLISRSGKCRTDVIGDITPFEFTYPAPFFVETPFRSPPYDMSVISSDKIGTILLLGALLAFAGTVQGLMTVEVVSSYIDTPADASATVLANGIANIVSGFLGGMGGDAMIGLSTINCLNGGRGRLGPVVTALGVAVITMGAYRVLDYIPVAALSGIMIVVVLHTFQWSRIPYVLSAAVPSVWRPPINNFLRRRLCCGCGPKSEAEVEWMLLPERVDRFEALIIVIVTTITIAFNLPYAVLTGVCLAALRFAYSSSLEIALYKPLTSDGKHYELQGQLYFANAMRFVNMFDVANDPDEMSLILAMPPYDYSGYKAIETVKANYKEANKRLRVRVLNGNGELEPVQKPRREGLPIENM